MDKKTTLEMIAAISNANGTSGFEDEVVAAIRPYAEGLGEITEDRMRNLYIRRKENNGKRPVVQLDAHSDEVGFDLAEKLGIPVQDSVRSAGSTNGATIHLTEKAVPVIVIGVPVRYAHTHYGISAYADFDNAVKLACEILKRLDEEQIMSF